MKNDSIQYLIDKAVAFRDARDWKQYHTPKDVAISLSLEAAELLEIFQWSGSNTQADTEEKRNKIKEELADVLMYSLLMAHDLDMDISEIVLDKLAINEKKYPAELARGRADKYTAYTQNMEENK